ncbi:hypothetical protein JXA02_10645, partial [candidate division KSB1 bacterium]|nr:hypothetical protein [candidate division KSB1 bacterium]
SFPSVKMNGIRVNFIQDRQYWRSAQVFSCKKCKRSVIGNTVFMRVKHPISILISSIVPSRGCFTPAKATELQGQSALGFCIGVVFGLISGCFARIPAL